MINKLKGCADFKPDLSSVVFALIRAGQSLAIFASDAAFCLRLLVAGR